ncbi:MAG TPA: GNAT family N-acetyltransferase [Planctomycetota bacterium]|nr:GNAT family N-acetyltransferase [Planctomycetota bacterium]
MRNKRPRVLILHNIPREKPDDGPAPAWLESDAGVLEEVEAVRAALEKIGAVHRTAGVANLTDLPAVLSSSTEDVVFNLVEGFHTEPMGANFVPAICQAFGKECTGNTTPCLQLTLDKWQTKGVLNASALPCAAGVLVPVGKMAKRSMLPAGPYIVKPTACDASEGIEVDSFVSEFGSLRRIVRRIHEQFGQPALIEQYVGNRELNVSVLQRGNQVDVLAIAEIDFTAFSGDKPRIVDYSAKWLPETFEYQNTPRILPAPISEQAAEQVRRYALDAWAAVGCRDYARVDFRLDDDGQPTILELNANPDISPEGGFAAAVEYAKLTYEQFVELMVANGYARLRARREPQKSMPVASPKTAAPPAASIRWSQPADRNAILAMLSETDAFRPDEIDVAAEVLDDALAHGDTGHYQSFVAEQDGEVTGWVCFGPTPCTLGTFDVYWIAVTPRKQSKGLGSLLMAHAEKLIKDRGGRLAVVETSGRPSYLASRRFYLAKGYREVSRLRDFYAPDDDKIIYTKELD